MEKRIVVTGLGILTSNAKGRQEYWHALKEGIIGYKPITLFDTSEFDVKEACEISDFDPTIWMGKKGLRNLDRSIMLMVSVAKLAIEDSGIIITEENTDDIGVVAGTTLGSLKSIAEFDEVTLKEGPRYTNPAHFPNTVINSPASQVSIWHNIKGLNITLSTGFVASMDAIECSCDYIDDERCKIVFGGGVEEMCWHTFFGFHALKYLSGSKDKAQFINCPFDKRRNGAVFGEGSCLISFEDYNHAKERNANILGEVISFGYYFDPFRLDKCRPSGIGLKKAMEEALANAKMLPKDIDCIFSNANSTKPQDKIEAKVINEVFGKYASKVPVTAIKSMVGECYSVSGSFAVAAALGSLSEGFIPPTVNYTERDPECDLNIISGKACSANVKNVMVTNFGPGSAYVCMILRKV